MDNFIGNIGIGVGAVIEWTVQSDVVPMILIGFVIFCVWATVTNV